MLERMPRGECLGAAEHLGEGGTNSLCLPGGGFDKFSVYSGSCKRTYRGCKSGGWKSYDTTSFGQSHCLCTRFGHRMTTGNGIIGWIGSTGHCSLLPISCWQSVAEPGSHSVLHFLCVILFTHMLQYPIFGYETAST